MHPSEVLFQGLRQPASLPVCDHYAGVENRIRKSVELQRKLGPVFDVTLDCEDGAATGNERLHAQMAANVINSEENVFNRLGARVHDVGSAYFEDDVRILCSAAAKLAYLVVPKVNGVGDTQRAIDFINQHAKIFGRQILPVHVLIETHGALAEVSAIAALPQVECLSFGIMDFVSEHYGAIPARAMRSPAQFTHPLVTRAKLEIAAACHAHGKIPSHNVTTELRDMGVVEQDAGRAAQEFGYLRMWSIHPDQIQPILKAFTPPSEEVHEAVTILAAARDVEWGPIQHGGRLHDRASYRYYWTVLRRARASGSTLPPMAAGLL
jgi:citrate lyase subunit beta/citryl-CoA lyase